MHRRFFLGLCATTALATISPDLATAEPADITEVNAKDYGAIGDGTTDDTAALHAARDATGVGGKIVIPSGTYLVSGLTANVPDQTWALSDGAVIKMEVGAKTVLSITATGVSVVGGIFDCSNVTEHSGSANGIEINADSVTINNVTVENSPFYGIAAYNHSKINISDCSVTNSYIEGIWVQNTLAGPSHLYDIVITGNLVDNSSGGTHSSGIGVHGNSANQRINRVQVSGNTIRVPYNQASLNTGCIGPLHCTDLSVIENECHGSYISISCATTVRGVISNNVVRGFKYVGIELPEGAYEVTVSGNIIDADGVEAKSGIQASAGSMNNVTINGNTIGNFPVGPCTAISFNSGAALNGVVVSANTLSSAVTAGEFNGILCAEAATNVTISENVIDASSTADSWGIQVLNSTKGMAIIGNRFGNIAKSAVLLYATGAGITFDHIYFTGNMVKNCGAGLTNSVGGNATSGPNIVADLRDSNANPSLASTVTSGGTSTLTIASSQVQLFTGISAQTVKLPTSGVNAGVTYTIVNNSTGLVTVQTSSADTIDTVAARSTRMFVAQVDAPANTVNWSAVGG